MIIMVINHLHPSWGPIIQRRDPYIHHWALEVVILHHWSDEHRERPSRGAREFVDTGGHWQIVKSEQLTGGQWILA